MLPVAIRVASTAASAWARAGRRPSARSPRGVDSDDRGVVAQRRACREVVALGRGDDDADLVAVPKCKTRALALG